MKAFKQLIGFDVWVMCKCGERFLGIIGVVGLDEDASIIFVELPG